MSEVNADRTTHAKPPYARRWLMMRMRFINRVGHRLRAIGKRGDRLHQHASGLLNQAVDDYKRGSP